MDNILTKKISETLYNAKTFAIITHKRPDLDAISSSLAMFWYLLDIGKKSTNIDVLIPEYNSNFYFIPGLGYLKNSATKEEYDVLIVVDCADLSKLECVNIINISKQVICFDHHEEMSINATFGIIDTTSPSCTCIIYETFPCMSRPFLNCIALGLIYDKNNLKRKIDSRGENLINALREEVNTDYLYNIFFKKNKYNYSAIFKLKSPMDSISKIISHKTEK